MNKKARIKVGIVIVTLVFIILLTSNTLSENISSEIENITDNLTQSINITLETTEENVSNETEVIPIENETEILATDPWNVTDSTFTIDLSGTNDEVPIIEQHLFQLNNGWYVKPLELDPLHTQTWNIINPNTISIEINYPNEVYEQQSYLTLCLFDETNQQIIIEDEILAEPDYNSEFCPNTKSWRVPISKDIENQIRFTNPPNYIEIWTDNGAGGGGGTGCTCVEGVYDVDVEITGVPSTIEPETNSSVQGYASFIGGECYNTYLYWQSNVTGTWDTISATGTYLDCQYKYVL